MSEIEEQGIEIEAPTTFSGAALADEDTVQGYDEEDAEQQHEESMNDESVGNETSYANAGYSYITSNIKWFVIAMASFAVFLGIGLGSGYGIGNEIWGNDNGASSVSSAMATVDYTTSDNGAKSGKSEGGGGAKSGKSSGSKSGKSCKAEKEQCVRKPKQEKNPGCKADPAEYEDLDIGSDIDVPYPFLPPDNAACGTLSRYNIKPWQTCPVDSPGGSEGLCYDVDFYKFTPESSGLYLVQFTWNKIPRDLLSYFPVVFENIYQQNCNDLTRVEPNVYEGTFGGFFITDVTFPGPSITIAYIVELVDDMDYSIAVFPTGSPAVGRCGARFFSELNYAFGINKLDLSSMSSIEEGEVQAALVETEELGDLTIPTYGEAIANLTVLWGGNVGTSTAEDGFSQTNVAVANSNDE